MVDRRSRFAVLVGHVRGVMAVGEEAGGVTCGPRPAVQPSLESFGVAAGQLIEQLGSSGDQALSLAGGHGVLQGGEAGAPPPAQLGVTE